MKAKIALMGGLGFPVTETAGGLPRLRARLEAIGATVLMVSWSDRQEVYDFLHGYTGFRALIGDSLGAGSAAQYAGDQKGSIDFVGGFQPSMDDARVNHGKIVVPANVLRAHCIYDPFWLDTLGLGQAQYIEGDKTRTKLLTTEHRGAHPDDWGYSQDIMFNEIKELMK